MLYYNKPIMGMYLAETMLNEHYRAHKKRKELAELKHFAREASVKDSRLWGKILFRIMKQETNYVLVDMEFAVPTLRTSPVLMSVSTT